MKFILVLFSLAVAVSAVPDDEADRLTLEQIENDGPMMHDKTMHGIPTHPAGVLPPGFGAIPPGFGAIPKLRVIPHVGTVPTVGALPTVRVATGYPHFYGSHLRNWPYYRHGPTAAITRTIPYVY